MSDTVKLWFYLVVFIASALYVICSMLCAGPWGQFWLAAFFFCWWCNYRYT